jgi:NAD(P)-dependent dehydrogenase (short-subunit alcohol dehydrogenase family)
MMDTTPAGRLANKVAVISGATSGIGRATAELFSAHGARLVVMGRNGEAATVLVQELGADRTIAVVGDLIEPQTTKMAMSAAGEFGSLDILVNNAGIDYVSDLYDTEIDDVRRVLEVNFVGAFRLLQAAARKMRGRGGSIVNVSSRTALVGVPSMAIYGASKGALTSLTRGAAIDLAGDLIRVNAVAPGFTETPLMTSWLTSQDNPGDVRLRAVSQIPQRRFATPEDVAAAILYLASDESTHVTGITLPVDGGYTAA